MKLKKLLCLVLAILMMLSMVACGQDTGDGEKDGSSKKPSENPTVPSSTGEPTLEDIGPWVVTEEYDYRGDRFVYQYDESGELVSYEAFDGTKKYRDYVATYTVTAEGGKVTVIESKHVQDEKFEKSYEIEYNAKGDMIRYSNYYRDEVTSEYIFTYDAEGYLTSYVYSYEGMLGDPVKRTVNYTFRDGLLRNVEQFVQIEGKEAERENAYSYDYDAEGYLKTIQYTRGEESGVIDLETNIYGDMVILRVADDCDHYVPNRNLISIKEYQDDYGLPSEYIVILNSWGFQQIHAYPYFLMGMANSSNWQYCAGKVTFTRLDVYLAEKE